MKNLRIAINAITNRSRTVDFRPPEMMLKIYEFTRLRKVYEFLMNAVSSPAPEQGRDAGSPERRTSCCASCENSRPALGQSPELVSVRFRLPDEVRRFSAGKETRHSPRSTHSLIATVDFAAPGMHPRRGSAVHIRRAAHRRIQSLP